MKNLMTYATPTAYETTYTMMTNLPPNGAPMGGMPNGAGAPVPPAGYAPQAMPGYAPQPMVQPAPQHAPQPAPQGMPPQAPYSNQQPYPTHYPVAPAQNTSVERLLGGKVLGIVASILVLTGLVLVGVTFIPQLPDMFKAIFLFISALLLTGAGTAITLKQRNAFSLTLLACGILAFFVATMATHSYFNLLPSVAALALTAGWMAVSCILIKVCDAWPLTMVLGPAAALGGIYAFENMGSFALAFALTSAYCAALAGIGMHLSSTWRTAPERADVTKCLASLIVGEVALILASVESAWSYSHWTALVCMGAILVALKLSPLPSPLAENRIALRVNELAILGACALPIFMSGMAGGNPDGTSVVLLSAFMVLVAVLVVSRIVDLFKAERAATPVAFPVLEAIVATALVLTYLVDGLGVVTSAYVWSAIAIVCSLVAIGVGFAARHKELRLYGLIASLLCVFKITVLDMSGSTLEHAAALIVGGLVCFAISALYSFAAKKIDETEEA